MAPSPNRSDSDDNENIILKKMLVELEKINAFQEAQERTTRLAQIESTRQVWTSPSIQNPGLADQGSHAGLLAQAENVRRKSLGEEPVPNVDLPDRSSNASNPPKNLQLAAEQARNAAYYSRQRYQEEQPGYQSVQGAAGSLPNRPGQEGISDLDARAGFTSSAASVAQIAATQGPVDRPQTARQAGFSVGPVNDRPQTAKQAGYNASVPNPRSFWGRVQTARSQEGFKNKVDTWINLTNKYSAQAPPYDDEGHMAGQNEGVGSGGTSGGGSGSDDASVPPNAAMPQLPRGMSGMSSDAIARIRNESLNMPRFGEWKWQDYARMGRDWFGRWALNAQQTAIDQATAGLTEGTPEYQAALDSVSNVGGMRGTIAGLANIGVNSAAQIETARRMATRVLNIGQGQTEIGASLGYSPQEDWNNVLGLPFGIRAPWSNLPGIGSAAAQEGWRQKLTDWRLQAKAGISGSDARDITNTLSKFGYSGADNQNAALDVFAPLVQQGQTPEDIGPLFDQAVRYGGSSLKDFTDTMKDLNGVAIQTRQTLTNATQSMAAYAQASQEAGSTYAQGQKASNEFSQTTGMPATVGAQMLQSPMVQGLAMQRFGLLPQQMGNLPGSAIAGLSVSSVNMMMNAFSGMNRPTTIHLPGGNTYQISGLDNQAAMVSSVLGITPEQVKQMSGQHGRQILAASPLSGMLTAHERAYGAAHQRFSHEVGATSDRTVYLPYGRRIDGGTAAHRVYDNIPNPVLKQLQDDMTNPDVTSRREIINQMAKAGVGQKERNRLAGIKSEGDFDKEAKKTIENLTKMNVQPDNQVYVKFTGTAAKFFRQSDVNGHDIQKSQANAGGSPINTQAVANWNQAYYAAGGITANTP